MVDMKFAYSKPDIYTLQERSTHIVGQFGLTRKFVMLDILSTGLFFLPHATWFHCMTYMDLHIRYINHSTYASGFKTRIASFKLCWYSHQDLRSMQSWQCLNDNVLTVNISILADLLEGQSGPKCYTIKCVPFSLPRNSSAFVQVLIYFCDFFFLSVDSTA